MRYIILIILLLHILPHTNKATLPPTKYDEEPNTSLQTPSVAATLPLEKYWANQIWFIYTTSPETLESYPIATPITYQVVGGMEHYIHIRKQPDVYMDTYKWLKNTLRQDK